MGKGEKSGRREIATIMAIPNLQGTTIPCDKLEHMLDLWYVWLGGGAWVRLYLITRSLLCSEIFLYRATLRVVYNIHVHVFVCRCLATKVFIG